jgi:hypothetical protein
MNINDLKKSQNEKQTIFHEKRQSVLILFNTFIYIISLVFFE